MLPAAALFLAAGALTKNEGEMFALTAILAALAVARGGQRRPLLLAARRCLPRRPSVADLDRGRAGEDRPTTRSRISSIPRYLADHADRVGPSAHELLWQIWTIGKLELSRSCWRSSRLSALPSSGGFGSPRFAAGWLVLSFAGLTAIYWISIHTLSGNLYNSSDRTIDSLVLTAGLLAPVLLFKEREPEARSPYAQRVIRGAFAAALTPLRDGGAALDEGAVEPYVAFLAEGGVDGILVCGTTGEGILLTAAERMRLLELFIAAARGKLAVAAHCGAQTTAETAALAAHAAEAGADAVAVIGPPFFPLDEAALEEHFAAAAAACAPLAFYVYEFAARSGYAVPVAVDRAAAASARRTCAGSRSPTSPGRRSSRTSSTGSTSSSAPSPWSRAGSTAVRPGPCRASRRCIPRSWRRSCASRTQELSDEAERLRSELDRFPFQAAAKVVAARRGRADPARRARAASPAERRRARGARAAVILVAGGGAMGAGIAYRLALARRR